MNTVLILFTYDDWAEISQIYQDLKEKGKDVILWTVCPKKENQDINLPPEVNAISPKEISRWMGLSPEVTERFKQLSYDTLLDLTSQNDKSLLYLLANNSAEFCIGIREQDFKVYDLIILKEDNSTLPETYDQIKFYLNNIQ